MSRLFLFILIGILSGCSSLQMKQNLFSPDNHLFLEGRFSLVEEKQSYVIQESGWGKILERASQILTFPMAMFQIGNSLEEQYEASVLKIMQAKKRDPEIPVQHLLKSEDSEVRGLALELTAKENVLLKYLKDSNDFVRMQALEKLREFHSTEVAVAVEAVVREDPEEFVRIEGIRTLGELHFPESLNTLAFCLKDTREHIRKEAISALRHYAPKQAVPLLFLVLNDPIFFVRETANTVFEEVLNVWPHEKYPPYDPSALPEERIQQVQARLQWWGTRKEKE